MKMASEEICKSKTLIEASYTLSVAEQRIILAGITQIDRSSPITDEVVYSVPVASIAKVTGSCSKSIYKELHEASQKLRQRVVSIELEPNKTLEARWVQSIVYREQEGVIDLRFNKDILPYLTGFKEPFARYTLSDVARMTSIYGIRLFEMLVQYTSIGSREISLVDLRKWLQLNDRYALMADLRRHVIELAINQINEHSPLQVRYEFKRNCRTITHLNFIIGHQRVPAVEAEPVLETLNSELVEEMADPLFDYDPAQALDGPEAMALFIADALDSGDAACMAKAMRVVARAQGMNELAKETGLARELLYESFSDQGNPTLKTMQVVMRALGVELTARPYGGNDPCGNDLGREGSISDPE